MQIIHFYGKEFYFRKNSELSVTLARARASVKSAPWKAAGLSAAPAFGGCGVSLWVRARCSEQTQASRRHGKRGGVLATCQVTLGILLHSSLEFNKGQFLEGQL